MNLLITGGFGYLGGRLAQFLAKQVDYHIALGSRQQVIPPLWLHQVKVVKCQWASLTELDEICTGVDAIVHTAGMNAKDCADDPVAALEFNGVATARLIQAAIRSGVKRFVYLSTAHVYGSPLKGVITEESCPVATHPYATSHRAGEDVVVAAHQRGEIEGVVIRLSNSFGAPTHIEANCWMLLVNDLCRQALTTKRMILKSGGRQKRDFVTLSDVCRAIKHLLEIPIGKVGSGIFNVGGAWSPSVLEMTKLLAQRIRIRSGYMPEIIFENIQNQDSDNLKLLDYRINKLLDTGFEHIGDVNNELDGLVKFCLENINNVVL